MSENKLSQNIRIIDMRGQNPQSLNLQLQKQLKYLDVSGCGELKYISCSATTILASCTMHPQLLTPNVKVLVLSGCGLTSFGMVPVLNDLISLDVSFCNIIDFSGWSFFPRLQSLFISGNPIPLTLIQLRGAISSFFKGDLDGARITEDPEVAAAIPLVFPHLKLGNSTALEGTALECVAVSADRIWESQFVTGDFVIVGDLASKVMPRAVVYDLKFTNEMLVGESVQFTYSGSCTDYQIECDGKPITNGEPITAEMAGHYLTATANGQELSSDKIALFDKNYFDPVVVIGPVVFVVVREHADVLETAVTYKVNGQQYNNILQVEQGMCGQPVEVDVWVKAVVGDRIVSDHIYHELFELPEAIEFQAGFGNMTEADTISANLQLMGYKSAEWYQFSDIYNTLRTFTVEQIEKMDFQFSHDTITFVSNTDENIIALKIGSHEQLNLAGLAHQLILCCYDKKHIIIAPYPVIPQPITLKSVKLSICDGFIECTSIDDSIKGIREYEWLINNESIEKQYNSKISLANLISSYQQILLREKYSEILIESCQLQLRDVIMAKIDIQCCVTPRNSVGIVGKCVKSPFKQVFDCDLSSYPEYADLIINANKIISHPQFQVSTRKIFVIDVGALLKELDYQGENAQIFKLNRNIIQKISKNETIMIYKSSQDYNFKLLLGSDKFFSFERPCLVVGKKLEMQFNNYETFTEKTRYGFILIRKEPMRQKLNKFEEQLKRVFSQILKLEVEDIQIYPKRQYELQNFDTGCSMLAYYFRDYENLEDNQSFQIILFECNVKTTDQIQNIQISLDKNLIVKAKCEVRTQWYKTMENSVVESETGEICDINAHSSTIRIIFPTENVSGNPYTVQRIKQKIIKSMQ